MIGSVNLLPALIKRSYKILSFAITFRECLLQFHLTFLIKADKDIAT